jgi:hypothetical protein
LWTFGPLRHEHPDKEGGRVPATVTRTIILRGGAVPPSALAWRLREHGVEVEPWEAPEEGRGLGTDIVIGLIVNGLYDAIKAGLADFLATFPKADAHIEGKDDDSDDDGTEEPPGS